MTIFSRILLPSALVLAPFSALSQTGNWPTRAIKFVIPFPAGSVVDNAGRPLLEKLSEVLGQPIIVENRAGAGGVVGTASVAAMPADGYTFMIHSKSFAVSAVMNHNLSYKPEDFVGVIAVASSPVVMVVSTAKDPSIHTLKDFIEKAKKQEGGATYTSTGPGGSTHLGVERMRLAANFPATHIPMKGVLEALTEIVAGRVDFTISPVGITLPFIKSGKLTPLVVTSAQRTTLLPDVPTSIEVGVAASDYASWVGMLAPAKTPRTIVERMNTEVAKILDTPDMRKRFAAQGLDTMITNAQAFDAFVANDIKTTAELVKVLKIETN